MMDLKTRREIYEMMIIKLWREEYDTRDLKNKKRIQDYSLKTQSDEYEKLGYKDDPR